MGYLMPSIPFPVKENVNEMETEIGSMIYAVKPGDGSAREQAASCQRVIGGLANITKNTQPSVIVLM